VTADTWRTLLQLQVLLQLQEWQQVHWEELL
jgi:hypothetical protein